MSGTSKKSGRRVTSVKKLNKNFGDITLNDYANSPVSAGQGRLRKAASNNGVREVRHLAVHQDDRHWDERLEELMGDIRFPAAAGDHEDEDEDQDGDVSEPEVTARRPARRRKRASGDAGLGDREYPLDVWFLISEWIRPEDVSRFACICRAALQVAASARFWFQLYRRHYRSGLAELPEALQPESMARLYGLRARVVRSLQYTYPPFVARTRAPRPFEELSEALLRRRCVLMWHQKAASSWTYYFKLKRHVVVVGRGGPAARQPDLLEMLEDVSANHEEGCKLLQVTCQDYVSVPLVLGLTLCSACVTQGQGSRSTQRLQLVFGSARACFWPGTPVMDATLAVLDLVSELRVLDWWHPLYPAAGGPQLRELD
ncbi:transmembrane protein 183 isoform X2 [Bacillus rossius redtenbacheri]|uniref:transmembrane protein 183 isoform X2 n=1 Tax=Bacillus rossius redtenbacheri TaxID=93214 RepID=UPI002FDDD063